MKMNINGRSWSRKNKTRLASEVVTCRGSHCSGGLLFFFSSILEGFPAWMICVSVLSDCPALARGPRLGPSFTSVVVLTQDETSLAFADIQVSAQPFIWEGKQPFLDRRKWPRSRISPIPENRTKGRGQVEVAKFRGKARKEKLILCLVCQRSLWFHLMTQQLVNSAVSRGCHAGQRRWFITPHPHRNPFHIPEMLRCRSFKKTAALTHHSRHWIWNCFSVILSRNFNQYWEDKWLFNMFKDSVEALLSFAFAALCCWELLLLHYWPVTVNIKMFMVSLRHGGAVSPHSKKGAASILTLREFSCAR